MTPKISSLHYSIVCPPRTHFQFIHANWSSVELDRLRTTSQQVLTETMYEIIDPLGEECYWDSENRRRHFFWSLNPQRNDLKFDELFPHIHHEDSRECFTPALKSFAIMLGFRSLGAFPPDFLKASIAGILWKLRFFNEEDHMDLFGRWISENMSPCDSCEETNVENSIKEMDKKVMAAATGICLECLKASRDMSERRTCCPD